MYQIDAFTEQVFGGNPAAIIPLDRWLDDKVLQAIAAENNLRPDFSLLAKLDLRGVGVTAKGAKGTGVDFVSRFFAPKHGINEDPVTGSLHCALTPLWATKLNKMRLTARQVSARGGAIKCEWAEPRVLLSGGCVKYMEGFIEV